MDVQQHLQVLSRTAETSAEISSSDGHGCSDRQVANKHVPPGWEVEAPAQPFPVASRPHRISSVLFDRDRIGGDRSREQISSVNRRR